MTACEMPEEAKSTTPILKVSEDKAYLIFHIDKDSLRKLAAAATQYLERDSRPAENSKSSLKDQCGKIINVPSILIDDVNVQKSFNGVSNLLEKDSSNDEFSKISENESLEQDSDCVEDMVQNVEEKLPESSFARNVNTFMEKTATNAESMSVGGDLESKEVKSIASESDDSIDSEKHATIRKGISSKKKLGVDEIDCAPTGVRRKAVSVLSKDTIKDNFVKISSGSSNLKASSKISGRLSPVRQSLRSKSLDPTPLSGKRNLQNKYSSIVESEDGNSKTRAKTPDIVMKRDKKMSVRSSPRKLTKQVAAVETSSSNSKTLSSSPRKLTKVAGVEPSSSLKEQTTKNNIDTNAHSKS